VRWQHSALTRHAVAPAPGTASQAANSPPEMTLHPLSAGTIAAMDPGRKTVLRPALTASRATNKVDFNGGKCLRYHRQPLHCGQVQ
jgi:hypothetical protein